MKICTLLLLPQALNTTLNVKILKLEEGVKVIYSFTRIKSDCGVLEFRERFETHILKNMYISFKKEKKDEKYKNFNTNFLPFNVHCI